MIIEGSSNIIDHVERSEINSQTLELLHLVDNKVIVLSANTIALYRDATSVSDPLGNGLIGMASIEGHSLEMAEPVVVEHKSGYVGLAKDQVLLILPNAIKLFQNKVDALQGANAICMLDLEGIH